MKIVAAALLTLLLSISSGLAQSSSGSANPRSHAPVRSIKIGKASFHYYAEPEVVVATTTFYISGSETKSVLFDFVALTAVFYNPGPRLATPQSVRFNVAASTYRDGCKYRDQYADHSTNQLHLNIVADEQSVFATDLKTEQVGEVMTRHGKVCSELYGFELPYEKFERLVEARKAAVMLGTRSFELKHDHLEAMRTMKTGIGRY